MVRGCLEQSNHEIIEFFILGGVRKRVCKTTTLNLQRANFWLFRMLVERVPSDTVLMDKGV